MEEAKRMHARLLRRGAGRLQPLLLRLVAVGNLTYALSLVSQHPSPALHNHLLHAIAKRGTSEPSHFIFVFSSMHRRNMLTPFSFTLLFSGPSPFTFKKSGHALLVKVGYRDHFLGSALVSMHAKAGFVDAARMVFDEMSDCRGVAVCNALLAGYVGSGDMDTAEELFRKMSERNVVSWTTMVSGYAKNQRFGEAVQLFSIMAEGEGVRPNAKTVASVLPACAAIGSISKGVQVERYARENGLMNNAFVANALVEMYAKCGSLEDAWRIFNEMGLLKDVCSWNSMIMGLAVHGRCEEVLKLFDDMKSAGFCPDSITMVGVLSACSHGGLVDQGRHLFSSMTEVYGVVPRLEHYGCIVDLLGRAGRLNEAYNLIMSMPVEPDAVVWGALLGACSFHGNVELAKLSADFLKKLEPANMANRVLLSNTYASSQEWAGVAEAWMALKAAQNKKSPGHSYVEVDGELHHFLVQDFSHPGMEQICGILDVITIMITEVVEIEVLPDLLQES